MTTTAYLYVGAVLFAAGALGTVLRPTAWGRLVGIEVMFAAATLTFAAAGAGFRELDGQIAAIVVLVIGLAQAAVGLSLVAGPRR
jgi:NADH:ubiquinone oxidoreductase subunit K